MNNIYDVCNLIFENDINKLEHNYRVDIQDFDDYIEITTDIVFDGINRGWVGNITFHFEGHNIKEFSKGRTEQMRFMLRGLLCSRITFDKEGADVARWTYTFLKY